MSYSTPCMLAVFSVLLCSAAIAAEEPILKDLYKPHPRLFIRSDELDALRQSVRNDPRAKEWHAKLLARAEKMLPQEPVQHVLIGPRLLNQSRTALDRIATLAGLYLIDGNQRFAERARLEMLTAAAFKDWNPSHFLDVAEMTNALAIGYDWLYDFLSPEDRKTIRSAIIALGLKPGLDGFEKGAWWTKATHNWSQVCNGGLTVGALAVAEDEPEMAERLIALGRTAIRPSMHAFAPDGGFAEGPGYWGYATIYNIYYLAAIESALGTDFGLNQMPGFAQTGFFRIHCVSPIGRFFNYADAGDRAGLAPQMFYLARIFKEPAFANHELGLIDNSPNIFHLIWHTQLQASQSKIKNQESKIKEPPLAHAFRGVNVAFFRSQWNDRNAIFAGIKGGDNRANHSHLDLGSFVLDALGRRWAVDLGSDDYNLPGYFGKQRWTYYRLRTESHNTITLDGDNQSPDGKAPIIAFKTEPQRSHVVIDLTHGYRTKASKVLRGLAMLDRRQILVQDEIETSQPVEVVWNFLTPSKISIDGQTATLSQGTARLQARILSPADATFAIVPANPPVPQKQQPGVSNLTVRLSGKAKEARIVVLLTPGTANPGQPAVTPLKEW